MGGGRRRTLSWVVARGTCVPGNSCLVTLTHSAAVSRFVAYCCVCIEYCYCGCVHSMRAWEHIFVCFRGEWGTPQLTTQTKWNSCEVRRNALCFLKALPSQAILIIVLFWIVPGSPNGLREQDTFDVDLEPVFSLKRYARYDVAVPAFPRPASPCEEVSS